MDFATIILEDIEYKVPFSKIRAIRRAERIAQIRKRKDNIASLCRYRSELSKQLSSMTTEHECRRSIEDQIKRIDVVLGGSK